MLADNFWLIFPKKRSATMSTSMMQLSGSSVHVALQRCNNPLQNTGTRQWRWARNKLVKTFSFFFVPTYEATYSGQHAIRASRTSYGRKDINKAADCVYFIILEQWVPWKESGQDKVGAILVYTYIHKRNGPTCIRLKFAHIKTNQATRQATLQVHQYMHVLHTYK